MAVPRLEFISQIAAAKLFWPSPTPSPTLRYKTLGQNFIEELEKIYKEAEVKLNKQIQWWKQNELITEGLKKIRRIHIEFEDWNYDFHDDLIWRKDYILSFPGINFSYYDPRSEYFMTNFLTSDGKFDDYKLVKKLVNDNNCNPQLRFALACGYFMEDKIRQLWNNCSLDDRIHNRSPYHHAVHFCVQRMFNPTDDPDDWEREFGYQLHWGRQPALLYVWNKLTPLQQSMYVDDVDKMAFYILRCNQAISFLFSLLNVETQGAVIERCYTNHYKSFLTLIADGLVSVRSDKEFFKCLLQKFPLHTHWDLLFKLCRRQDTYAVTVRLSCPQSYFGAIHFLWGHLRNDNKGWNDHAVQMALDSWKMFKRWDCYFMVVNDVKYKCREKLKQ